MEVAVARSTVRVMMLSLSVSSRHRDPDPKLPGGDDLGVLLGQGPW